MSEYLKRKIDSYLLNWKNNVNHKPLIVKGARQVGKTLSIKTFGTKNYKNFIEINFISDPMYKQIIENGYTCEEIIKNISRINPNVKFVPNETLIFFDEVQAFPDIMTSLKFFSLDKRFDVIASVSSFGIYYNQISSISVGYKTEIELKSFDFEEFLWALGYDDSIKQDMLNHMLSFTPFSNDVLKLYNNLFLDYCIIGGMPDVVYDYIKNKKFENTLELQRQIVIAYEDDIKKYAIGFDKARISNVFRSISSQLGKENKKFQISKVKSGAKLKDYRGAFEWLDDAGVINVSRALESPNLPLKGNTLEDSCVIYYADSGLLLSQLDDEALLDFRQNKNFDVYKGGFFESIIAEALVKSGYELHYYKKENSTLQEEFFVRYKDYLVPIEVKASNNNAKSLSTLIKSDNYKEISFGIKIIKGNIGYAQNICTFPHFCSFLIKDFLTNFKYEK